MLGACRCGSVPVGFVASGSSLIPEQVIDSGSAARRSASESVIAALAVTGTPTIPTTTGASAFGGASAVSRPAPAPRLIRCSDLTGRLCETQSARKQL
jgi:hypothetical protein